MPYALCPLPCAHNLNGGPVTGSPKDHSMIEQFFEKNCQVVDSFFSQQERMIEIAKTSLPEVDRKALFLILLEINQKVLSDLLVTQEAGLKKFLKTAESASIPSVGPPSLPQFLSPSDDKTIQSTNKGNFEEWLRAEISSVTGVPIEMITSGTKFEEDLGLSSITLMELWINIIETFPELRDVIEGLEDRLRKSRTFGEVVEIILNFEEKEKSGPYLSKAISSTVKEETTPDCYPSPPAESALTACLNVVEPSTPEVSALFWQNLRDQLIRKIAAFLGIDGAEITIKADFENDLGLDIFTRQQLFSELLTSIPFFRQAGNELLKIRNFAQLEALLLQFLPPLNFLQSEKRISSSNQDFSRKMGTEYE